MIGCRILKKKTIIFQDIDFLNALLAIIFGFFGAQIYYLNIFLFSEKDFWMKKLSSLNIHHLGCREVTFNGDTHAFYEKNALDAAENIFRKAQKNILHYQIEEKIGGRNFKSELNITIKKQLYKFSFPLAEFVAFAKLFKEQAGITPVLVCDNNMISRELLKNENLNNLEPRVYTVIRYFSRVISKFLTLLYTYSYNKIKKKKIPQQSEPENIKKKYDVVYFPHKGINYGQLYIKDQFYSDEKKHPFYHKRILHLSLRDNESILEFSKKYYREKEIPNAEYYTYAGMQFKEKVSSIFWFVCQFFKTFAWKQWDLFVVAVYLYILLSILDNKIRLRNVGAKIIFVGYDFLFPVTIAMSATINGIKIIASQERFILSWANPFYIFDYYFSIGKSSNIELLKSKNVSIKKIYNIGSVRKDQLIIGGSFESFDLKKNLSNKVEGNTNVLVLDYHTDRSIYQSAGRQLNNAKFDKQFYKTIIEVAQKYPDLNFSIKGKNHDFLSIEEFKDIKNSIAKIKNLTVLTEYSYWTPYRAVSKSKFAIALHTSLGDEMLQIGKPVIFYDPPNFNYPSGYLNFYENIIARNKTELCERIDEILLGETNRYFNTANEMFFLTDTLAKKLLQEHLKNIADLYIPEGQYSD